MPSYEQNPKTKKWSVRFRAIEDGEERHKRLSPYDTKKEARVAYLEYQAEYSKKNQKEASKKKPQEMLFEVLAEKYMCNLKTRVRESSYITIQSKLDKHIIPAFGEKKIKDITPVFVLEWQQSLDKYAFAHKKSLRTLLSSIFKFGERYYDIQNVMLKVEPLRNTEPKKVMKFWTYEEYKKFISCCDEEDMRMLFKFLYITGCRKGECRAVKWRDIDFNNATLTIDKNITRKTKEGPYKIVPPKTETSIRVLNLPRNFCNEIKEWKSGNADEFIFGGEHPISEKRIERAMRKYAEIAGVKQIRIHDIRHSCASLLLSKRVSVVAVSHYFGHKDVEETLNTYAHFMPDEGSEILRVFKKV